MNIWFEIKKDNRAAVAKPEQAKRAYEREPKVNFKSHTSTLQK